MTIPLLLVKDFNLLRDFGSNVFNEKTMQNYLSGSSLERFHKAIKNKEPIPADVLDPDRALGNVYWPSLLDFL